MCYQHVNKMPLTCKHKGFIVPPETHPEPGQGSVISLEASAGAHQGPFLDPRAHHTTGGTLNSQAGLAFLI